MRRTGLVLLTLMALLAVTFVPAFAVTDGVPDGEGHPYVGLMVAHGWYPDDAGNLVYGPMWRCTGTLLSPTVFLTAGHCTEAPADHVEVWFDPDMQTNAATKGYPYTGEVSGTPYTHPDFYKGPWFTHDLGVVVLDTPVHKDEYGVLPQLGQLDKLKTKRGLQDVTFTAVGYGLQQSFPDAASWKDVKLKIRMVATPRPIQINGGIVGDFSLLLSNNAHTGGTCFGDSGGPSFLGTSNGNVVAGVTSFGMNPTCAGTGGVYRIDQADDLNWLETFGVTPQS